MKKLLRLIIPVLVFAIAGGIFMMNKMTARADVDNSTDPPTLNIGAGDYWEDQEMGGYLFVIARDNYEPSTNTFTVYDGQHNPVSTYQLGNITVPSGCTLAIDALLDETTNAWTFNSSYTGTITVEDGGNVIVESGVYETTDFKGRGSVITIPKDSDNIFPTVPLPDPGFPNITIYILSSTI